MNDPDLSLAQLSRALGTIVAVSPEELGAGRMLVALGESGPLRFTQDPVPERLVGGTAGVALIAGLPHVIIVLGSRRLDVLIPADAVTREGENFVVDSSWADRVRLVAAGARAAVAHRPPGRDEWVDLLTEQAVARAESVQRYSLSLERAIDRYVRDGDREALMTYLGAHPLELDAGRLADGNTLRGVQDLIISILAVATRSATSAGTSVPMAFSISDYFIREVERVSDAAPLQSVLLRALAALADAVSVSRHQGRSAIVRAAEEWIFLHLDDSLRPADIARALGVSTGHLATQFRGETGTTIDRYVQGRRVEQAQTMLTHTTLSISEICVRLGFYDQSHLTRVFRARTGETPQHYRTRTRPRSEA